MQREISTSGHYTSPLFTKSLHHSTFQPLLERESDNVLSSCLPRRQLMHQDLIARHNRVLSHLREVMKEAHDLHQEHVNLEMANIELKNSLNSLINKATPFQAPVMVPGPANMSEYESKVQSPGTPSLTDSRPCQVGRRGMERVGLPKSISVRSSGYVKGFEAGGSSGSGKIDNATQKVYVGGGKENQPLELEVFNQGMCKTELCNKWQQTGTCPYANNCQFAHGIEELRPVVRHPRYKTEVCRMLLTGVSCHYGHRCHFRHTLTDEEKIIKAMSSMSLENRAVELSRG